MPRQFSPLSAGAATAVLLSLGACNSPEITVYQAPKDLSGEPAAQKEPAAGADSHASHDHAAGTSVERPKVFYTAPPEWEDAGPDQMNLARFSVRTPQGSASVNITPLAGMSGQEALLVNMWRGALGQPELSPEATLAALQPVEIGTEKGFIFDVSGVKGQPVRILTAFLHRDGKSWFFKLQGDPQAVETGSGTFKAFLKTVRFEEKPAPPITPAPAPPEQSVATAPVDPAPVPPPAAPPVPTVETPAPAPAPPVEILPENPAPALPVPAPVQPPADPAPASPAPAVESAPVPANPVTPETAPPPPAPAPPLPAGLADAAPQAASEVPGSPPAEWTALPVGPMQAAKFSVAGPEEAKAEVAVSIFGSDTGGVLPNVNRWRTQLGMPQADDAAIQANIQKLEGGPEGAVFAALEHEGKALTGAIVPRGGRWFFYRLTGDAAAVRAAQEPFLNFVKSPQ